MTATKKQRMMTEGSVLGGLIRTALPLILANILYQSFHVADTLMVGRWGDPHFRCGLHRQYQT